MKIKKVLSLACAIAMVAGLTTDVAWGISQHLTVRKKQREVLQRILLSMEHQQHREVRLIRYWHIWEVTI